MSTREITVTVKYFPGGALAELASLEQSLDLIQNAYAGALLELLRSTPAAPIDSMRADFLDEVREAKGSDWLTTHKSMVAAALSAGQVIAIAANATDKNASTELFHDDAEQRCAKHRRKRSSK